MCGPGESRPLAPPSDQWCWEGANWLCSVLIPADGRCHVGGSGPAEWRPSTRTSPTSYPAFTSLPSGWLRLTARERLGGGAKSPSAVRFLHLCVMHGCTLLGLCRGLLKIRHPELHDNSALSSPRRRLLSPWSACLPVRPDLCRYETMLCLRPRWPLLNVVTGRGNGTVTACIHREPHSRWWNWKGTFKCEEKKMFCFVSLQKWRLRQLQLIQAWTEKEKIYKTIAIFQITSFSIFQILDHFFTLSKF